MEKNSLYLKNSRYVSGGISEATNGKIEWWDRRVFSKNASDNVYVLEKHYEGNPYHLALAFLGDTSLWWVLMQYNEIINPAEELIEGLILYIPSKDRIMNIIASSTTGGVQSTRTNIPQYRIL